MFNIVIFNVIMKINFKYLGRIVYVFLKKWYWGMSFLVFKKMIEVLDFIFYFYILYNVIDFF